MVPRRRIPTWPIVILIASGVAAASGTVRAEISAGSAKYCRAMMVKAHPTELFGASGTAALQRDYFKQCINRQGKMDDRAEPTTTGQSHQAAASTIGAWTIDENKSLIDGSPQVTATLKAVGYDATMSVRCRERKTEAIFDLPAKRASVGVLIRFADGVETILYPSTDGQSFYAGSAEQFIRRLPDSGTIRISTPGRAAGGEFNLGDFSQVRQKVAQACDWSSKRAQNPTVPK